jgi:phosphoesterase RecJ-like protein
MDLIDVKKAIDRAGSILLMAHIQPDGDTLGSSFALYRILEKLGKKPRLCCDGEMPERYAPLFPSGILEDPATCEGAGVLVITVDCADTARLGKCHKVFKRASETVNIDHHVTNEGFAHVNYIAEASSVGEIIFELMKLCGITPDHEIAKYLYIAMSTDTGNFTYSNTGPKCLAYISELVELFDLRETADILFRRRSLLATKLIGRAISRLEIHSDGKIASVTLLDSDMKEFGATGADCENIVDYAREIEETLVAVFFRELPTGVKISFRSKADIDVGTVAAAYGGGGHVNAAGCCANGKLEDVKRTMLDKLAELV